MINSIAVNGIGPHLVGALAFEVALKLMAINSLGHELLLVVSLEYFFIGAAICALVVEATTHICQLV